MVCLSLLFMGLSYSSVFVSFANLALEHRRINVFWLKTDSLRSLTGILLGTESFLSDSLLMLFVVRKCWLYHWSPSYGKGRSSWNLVCVREKLWLSIYRSERQLQAIVTGYGLKIHRHTHGTFVSAFLWLQLLNMLMLRIYSPFANITFSIKLPDHKSNFTFLKLYTCFKHTSRIVVGEWR